MCARHYETLTKTNAVSTDPDTFLSVVALTTSALMTHKLTTHQTHGRLLRQRVAYCTLASTIEIKDYFIMTRQSHQTCWVPCRTGSQQRLLSGNNTQTIPL